MDKKELKSKQNEPKKNLIRTQRESNQIKIIVTIVILLVAAITYYLIDSGSYAATIDGNRISKAEYQFFLSQQKTAAEQKQGLFNKTDAEKEAFWLTAEGQNLWETAKSESLNASKDYMIQIIKAKETGLKVDSAIKSEVAGLLESTKSTMTDKQFAEYVKMVFKITPNQLSKISENLMLIDKFKASYLKKQYTAAAITDEDVKAYYDKDSKKFDTVDIRYIYLSKLDKDQKELPQEQLDAKKKTAEEALSKIKQGGDIDKVITEYTEEEVTDTSSTKPKGSASITYSEGSELVEWIFANKPNDSGIVEMESDIFVVKIEKRSSFEDSKSKVKSTMENEEEEKFYDDALHNWSLEAKYNIIKNDRVYDSISYK